MYCLNIYLHIRYPCIDLDLIPLLELPLYLGIILFSYHDFLRENILLTLLYPLIWLSLSYPIVLLSWIFISTLDTSYLCIDLIYTYIRYQYFYEDLYNLLL